MLRRPLLVLCGVLLAAFAGCASKPGGEADTGEGTTSAAHAAPLGLGSASFEAGSPIPRRHTCDGEETSPPLDLTGFPEGTVSLALQVKDHDVPTPQTAMRTIDHWAVWHIDPSTPDFAEGGLPPGARQMAGGWNGPCPPQASPAHRYVFTVSALDAMVDLPDGAAAAELEAAMQGHVVASVELVGTYQRALV